MAVIVQTRLSTLFAYLWASPATLVGLFFALVEALRGGQIKRRNGVLLVTGGRVPLLLQGFRHLPTGAAMTVGHVIFARDQECLQKSLNHELVHVRQFERWGPFCLPASWAIALWLKWRGYDPYLDHPFENEAFRSSSIV